VSSLQPRTSKKGGVADYLNDVLVRANGRGLREGAKAQLFFPQVEDAQAKFVRGFRFRPPEELLFPFSCNLVSRNELVECVGFISVNFVCFLGQFDSVDDRGHKVTLRVIIPLRSIERILPICVVKGIYEPGDKVDAVILNTATARHQVVWIDEFDVVLPKLRGAWDKAQVPSRADDALPVSLVLNPEFASMSASSAETSPRSSRRLSVLRAGAVSEEEVSDSDSEHAAPAAFKLRAVPVAHTATDEEGDAVSDEYDSDHIESLASIERVAQASPDEQARSRASSVSQSSPPPSKSASAPIPVAGTLPAAANSAAGATPGGDPSAASSAVSPPGSSWSDVKI
jgi:hypothetical protein